MSTNINFANRRNASSVPRCDPTACRAPGASVTILDCKYYKYCWSGVSISRFAVRFTDGGRASNPSEAPQCPQDRWKPPALQKRYSVANGLPDAVVELIEL